MKKRILFVGSFKQVEGKPATGGQLFACSTLINSSLKQKFDWHLIDTTAPTNLSRSIFVRLISAIRRLLMFLNCLLFKKVDRVLIFVGHGFSFAEKGLMVIVAKLFGKKVIIAPRSGHIKNDIEKNNLLSLFVIYVLNISDIILCQGRSWKSFYQEKTKRSGDKFQVRYNWVKIRNDVDLFVDKDGPIKILFLGWVDKRKGVFDLINAVPSLIKKSNQEFIVKIAGNGNEFDECKKLISKLDLENEVNMLGWVSGKDKDQLLRESDVFILPSYAEGMPNSLLEAMMYGKACIASNVGSVEELLKNNTGIVVEKGNVKNIEEALSRVINDDLLRKAMSERAYKYVREHNSLANAVEHFEQILN